MLCADSETCAPEETQQVAERVRRKQVACLTSALRQVAKPFPDRLTAILAGSGEFLAQAALTAQQAFHIPSIVSLSERMGPEISRAACAYAVAVLAREQSP
jgi:uncharacterized hydantoinase/oxoprolinase family protein